MQSSKKPSRTNNSSADEWFRWDGDNTQQAAAEARKKLCADTYMVATEPEKIAAQELRKEWMERQKQKEVERAMYLAQAPEIQAKAREVVEEEKKREAELKEKKRLELLNNLNQQMVEREALKKKDHEAKQQFAEQQRRMVEEWKQQEKAEQEKRFRQMQSLQSQRKAGLMAVEQRRQLKSADGQSALPANNMVILSDGSKAFGLTLPKEEVQSAALVAKQRERQAVGSPLLQQIEDRKKAKSLEKQAEAQYAEKVKAEVERALEVEQTKARKVKEQNMVYKGFLDIQMKEKMESLATNMDQEAETARTLQQAGAVISQTRPW